METNIEKKALTLKHRRENDKLEKERIYSQCKTSINIIFDNALKRHWLKSDIESNLELIFNGSIKLSVKNKNRLLGYIECMFYSYQKDNLIYGAMIEKNVYTNTQFLQLIKEKDCTCKELTDNITERGMYYKDMFPMYEYKLW